MAQENKIHIDIPEAQIDFSNQSWKNIIKQDFCEIQQSLENKPNLTSPAYYTWFWFFIKYGRAISSNECQEYMRQNNLTVFTFVKDIVGLTMSGGGAYTIGYKFYEECLKNKNRLDACGLRFNEIENINIESQTKNNYRPFITAIKSKPFLLLAGISGTGKSRIVRELARACWDEDSEEYNAQKPKNFEMVQVKPNWHDSTELIGYVSRIGADKEGNGITYIAGDFLKFIARAWEEPNIPYFLCLDEMNLAPVEQYFAEYLSVIESRKSANNNSVVTDPLLEMVDENWYFNLTAKLSKDDNIRRQFNKYGITIPQNLIVVGTVNMDETTFSFSRKVLDRAMTIEMNGVDLHGGLQGKYEKIGKLGMEELIGTTVEGVDVYEAYKDVCDIVLEYLQSVNDVLDNTPFKIAYRTRNEFLLYVVNNLPYNKDANGGNLSEGMVIARALDEITSMKILSRIEGDDTKVPKSLLDNLTSTIREQLNNIVGEGASFESNVSLPKLKEMKIRLESGYTSFWS